MALHTTLLEILDGTAGWTELQAAQVVELLDMVDRTARGWAAIAHLAPARHTAQLAGMERGIYRGIDPAQVPEHERQPEMFSRPGAHPAG